ncbi:MAG: S9 family peptidase [Candidatus Latescibacterota bacterium]|nr:MAG: S9 family peptidase [Candidatus Latescibacterota bacterium]
MRWLPVSVMIVALMILSAPSPVLTEASSKSITFDDFISLGRVSDPQISPDGKHVVFVVTYYCKETNKGNSDIFMIPIEGGEARQLTQNPGSDSHPRFSPNGEWIAFSSSRGDQSQIWLLPAHGGEARQLTHVSTGASGPEWMPDGKHLIFTSSVYPDCPDDDCNAERIKEEEDNEIQARVYTDLLYRHWNEWLDERRTHILITSVDDETAKDLTPGDVNYPTLTLGSSHDYAISPDGKEICVAANEERNRERSINNDLFIFEIEGGTKTRITQNKANDNHPAYSPNGRFIAYRAMGRPGFEADQYRLMLYDRNTGETIEAAPDLAEKFDRSVRSIVWARDSKGVYVTCGDAGFVSLYYVDIRKRKTTQLTEKRYISSVEVRPDGKQIVFLAQNAQMPYEIFIADKKGKKITQISHINDAILATIDRKPLEEFFFEGAGGTQVQGFLLKPPGFDPAAKHPLVFIVHGGPQGAWTDSWHWRWNFQMWAAPGYVIALVNPRGSTGFGQKFTDEISRDWGGKVFDDLMKGLDHVLKTYPFIDGDRMAAAGASYGGYMMNWFAGHTDRFKCLINHDGVYNLTSMYGTTEELWFPEWEFGGAPWEGAEDYAKFSPHMYAKNFKTPMLVIHGGRDYRVDPSEGFQVFTAHRRQGVPAKFLYFPDEGHFVLKPLNSELWHNTIYDWLAEWLE